jgi:hypothetical protein
MRWLLLVLAAACQQPVEKTKPVPHERGSYQDIVTKTQDTPAVETRTALACADTIVVPPRRPVAAEPQSYYAVLERLLRTADGKGLAALTADERAVVFYDLMYGEVGNGGFHQFFFNSSGDDALEVRAAIERIGPPELLSIYDCALTAFPDSKPSRDRATRNSQLARWGERQFELFRNLDKAMFTLDTIQPALATFASTLPRR